MNIYKIRQEPFGDSTVTPVLHFLNEGEAGVTGKMSRQILRLVIFPFIVVIGVIVCVPGESLLIESDDNLWTLDVGLSSRYQVCLVTVLPAHTDGKNQYYNAYDRLNASNKCTKVQSHILFGTCKKKPTTQIH